MSATIGICTRNRAQLLAATLNGLTQLAEPSGVSWSVLVVDNGSTDSTPSVIEQYSSRLPLQNVVEPQAGLSAARNRLLEEADADYIFWIDDDVLVESDWLVEFCRAATRRPDAVILGAPIEPWFPVQFDADLGCAFPWLQNGFCGLDIGPVEKDIEGGQYVWGANFAVQTAALGGLRFDPSLGAPGWARRRGEETALIDAVRRSGGRVVWCPRVRVRHYIDPRRMTRSYLEGYAFLKGREYVFQGWLRLTNPAWFSVPRWLWRAWADAILSQAVSSVVPGGARLPARLKSGATLGGRASARVRRLTWAREERFLAGAITGFRELAAKGQPTLRRGA